MWLTIAISIRWWVDIASRYLVQKKLVLVRFKVALIRSWLFVCLRARQEDQSFDDKTGDKINRVSWIRWLENWMCILRQHSCLGMQGTNNLFKYRDGTKPSKLIIVNTLNSM